MTTIFGFCTRTPLDRVFPALGVGAICLLGAAVSPSTAEAQERVSQAVAGSSGPTETITITARRRAEDLQSVPDQVSAFPETKIRDAGIQGIEDVAPLSPGLFLGTSQPGVTALSLRGITQQVGQDAPVAFVIDGVTQAHGLLYDVPLFDIQQIEVLRGPQGALYGRNSIGGAIVVTTKRPTDEYEFDLQLLGASGDEYSVSGSISGPIVKDKLAFRVSGKYSDFGGYHRDIFQDRKVDFREGKYGRLSLLFTPTDRLSIDIIANGGKRHEGSQRFRPYNIPPEYDALVREAVPSAADLPVEGVIAYSFVGESRNHWWDTTAKIEWDADFGTFTSQTTYGETSMPLQTELDYTRYTAPWIPEENAGTTAEIAVDSVEVFTQEVRFTSPGDRRFRYIIGAFYQWQKRDQVIKVYLGRVPDGNQDIFLQKVQTNEAWAVFGQASYDITDTLEINLAGRYDVNDVTADRFSELTFLDVVTVPLVTDSRKFNDFQGKAQLSWQATDDMLVYATFSQGFRSGGFNVTDFYAIDYDKETLNNYEIGFKTSFFDNRVTFNGAYYYIDYSDQQLWVFEPGGAFTIVNADKSSIQGIDVEINAELVEGLDLTVGVAYIDSKLKKFGQAGNRTDIGPVPGQGVPTTDLEGNKGVYTYNYSVNVGLQYFTYIFDDLEFLARVDYVRNGRIFWGITNDFSQKPYDLVNLRVSVGQENWRVTAFVNNLFDEDYDTLGYDGRENGYAFGINIGAVGNPRHGGVEVTLSF